MLKRNKEYFYKISQSLQASIGDPEKLHQSSPLFYCNSALEVLLATILTQATSDKNALRVWLEFKKAFADLSQVLSASEEDLFTVIRPGGLAAQKAKTIRTVLQNIQDRLGECSLDSLKNDPQLAWDFLNQLPGVGPKTAACTMLFGLGLPQFPVDVHIERIVSRLGWISGKMPLAELQQLLLQQIPPELHADLHILLLNLGRQYCRPHNPDCAHCPLSNECPKRFKFT
jgi:endonuclease III